MINVIPGVRINITGRGLGFSVGPKGLKVGYSTRYGAYMYQSIPGTGIYRRRYFWKARHGARSDSSVEGEERRGGQNAAQGSPDDDRFRDVNARDSSAKQKVTSAFLLSHRAQILGLADADGGINPSPDWPAWLSDLYEEAQGVAHCGDMGIPQLLTRIREWQGLGFDGLTELECQCSARTPLSTFIESWADAIRHYKPFTAEVVNKVLSPSLAIRAGFQSLIPCNPESYTGAVFMRETVYPSTGTFVGSNEWRPPEVVSQGFFTTSTRPEYWFIVVAIAFGPDAGLIEHLSEPFEFAIVREIDELRYKFPGGMR